MKKLRIIVGGFIGVMPVGGVTWDYVQYPLGFLLMGHDVYYIEDTRLYPIYQKSGSNWDDSSDCIAHLKKVMEHFGLGDRWAYRDEASGKCFGMNEERIKKICAEADIFINVSCSTYLRDEYLKIPVRALIDSDPMFTQIQYESQEMFTPGQPGLREMMNAHSHHFTFGENVGNEDCLIPLCGLRWRPTRQPICLKYWKPKNGFQLQPSFSTLMNWSAAKVLRFAGEEWGQKDVEFQKFFTLPQQVKKASFSVVVNQTAKASREFSSDKIEEAGWTILDPYKSAGDWKAYQDFIDHSYGEFSVAKHTYIKARTGWFSCRSACYLAMGKPVVTQDTTWSRFIPSGKGVLAFNNREEAVAALDTVVADYEQQSQYATEIAKDFFDSTKVLNHLLAQL